MTNSPIYANNSNGSGNSSLVFRPSSAALANISTRMLVGTGDNQLIGGFILVGDSDDEKLLLRAIGPSLPLNGTLQDPVLTLFDGQVIRGENNNWRDTQENEILNTATAPTNDLESAILAVLQPLPTTGHGYTAIVSGQSGSTGLALVEVYDIGTGTVNLYGDAHLANISTRGNVGIGDDVLIGGFILRANAKVLIRAIGPSLVSQGLSDVLSNPNLELHDGSGILIAKNDDWQATELYGIIAADQKAEIAATGIPPPNAPESAIVATLSPGNYTAIVNGVGSTTGVALVEVYYLGTP